MLLGASKKFKYSRFTTTSQLSAPRGNSFKSSILLGILTPSSPTKIKSRKGVAMYNVLRHLGFNQGTVSFSADLGTASALIAEARFVG